MNLAVARSHLIFRLLSPPSVSAISQRLDLLIRHIASVISIHMRQDFLAFFETFKAKTAEKST